MKLYLAGPMRGRPFYNMTAFVRAGTFLHRRGHEVVSPVDLDREAGIDFLSAPHGTEDVSVPISELILRDVQAICDGCEGIVVLPGWEHSKGAQVEVALARFLDLPVFSLSEMTA